MEILGHGNHDIVIRDSQREIHHLELSLLRIRSLLTGSERFLVTHPHAHTDQSFPYRRSREEEALHRIRGRSLSRWQR